MSMLSESVDDLCVTIVELTNNMDTIADSINKTLSRLKT